MGGYGGYGGGEYYDKSMQKIGKFTKLEATPVEKTNKPKHRKMTKLTTEIVHAIQRMQIPSEKLSTEPDRGRHIVNAGEWVRFRSRRDGTIRTEEGPCEVDLNDFDVMDHEYHTVDPPKRGRAMKPLKVIAVVLGTLGAMHAYEKGYVSDINGTLDSAKAFFTSMHPAYWAVPATLAGIGQIVALCWYGMAHEFDVEYAFKDMRRTRGGLTLAHCMLAAATSPTIAGITLVKGVGRGIGKACGIFNYRIIKDA